MSEAQAARLVELRRARFHRFLLANDPRWVAEAWNLDRAWDRLVKAWGLR